MSDQDRIDALRAENARLRRGDFTPEEFQNLCHHRDEKEGCTPEAFMEGCREYQRKLFGACEADGLKQENRKLKGKADALQFDLDRWLSAAVALLLGEPLPADAPAQMVRLGQKMAALDAKETP